MKISNQKKVSITTKQQNITKSKFKKPKQWSNVQQP